MAGKPRRRFEHREVVYDGDRWALLEELRLRAVKIMEALERSLLEAVVHGSIARGDVTLKSDVDLFIPSQVSSITVETALEEADIPVLRRLAVQATPTYAMKAYIETSENSSISFSLMKMRKVEREFYRFGGIASLKDLREGTRVIGVDKRLMLIEPTITGHTESTIIGAEEHVAKLLGVSAESVLDRVHALLRRDKVGRTGVFLERELSNDETFEMIMKRLADKNPAIRRRLRLSRF